MENNRFRTEKSNVKIFERFRAACDVYFNKKSAFYKNIKEEMEKNLELKKPCVKSGSSERQRRMEEYD